MKKIIISGGPCSGKTTLFEALKEVYPEAYFVPEPAERVISRELDRKAIDPSYTPVLPTTHYPEFLPLVVSESVELENAIPVDAKLAILDRSLIDNVGYAYHYGRPIDYPMFDRIIAAAEYSLSLFLEPLVFEPSSIRLENPLDAQRLSERLCGTYITYMGRDRVLDVPLYPLASRVNYARFLTDLALS